MRDAFGGVFMMTLLLIIVTVLITFMSLTLKYVQAYRVKNQIINYIEQYNGFNQDVVDYLEGKGDDSGYLKRMGYDYSGVTAETFSGTQFSTGTTYCGKHGYCVEMEYCSDIDDESGFCQNGSMVYYKVSTYMELNFGKVLGVVISDIPISGETARIQYVRR